MDQRARNERVKEKRKQLMKNRLEKVKERKKLKLGIGRKKFFRISFEIK